MNLLKIALLQISPCKTLKENLEKGIQYCKKAKESDADIVLFPEMWSNGYNIYDGKQKQFLLIVILLMHLATLQKNSISLLV